MTNKDKCSKCGSVKSKTFWDYSDGTMLCDDCEKKHSEEWEKDHSKETPKWKKIVYILTCIVGLIMLLINSELLFQAPIFTIGQTIGIMIGVGLFFYVIIGTIVWIKNKILKK